MRVTSVLALVFATVALASAARLFTDGVGPSAAPGPIGGVGVGPCDFCRNIINEVKLSLPINATDEQIIEAIDTRACGSFNVTNKVACRDVMAEIAVGLNRTGEDAFAQYSEFAFCAIIGECKMDCCDTPYTPTQIHIATTGDPTEMVIMWSILEPSPNPIVLYGLSDGTHTWNETGTSGTYTVGGWRGSIQTVTLTGLTPNTRYYYQVGDVTVGRYEDTPNLSMPPDLSFVTPPSDSVPIEAAVIGDMGATDISDRTVARLIAGTLVDPTGLDLVLHVGDISYADAYQRIWDRFMEKIESLAAYYPYMVCPGNHEAYFNFTSYMNRFTMPAANSGSGSDSYYSFNYGNVHFVAYDAEKDNGDAPDLIPEVGQQWKWLQDDLAEANQNRDKQPWIVVMGHRPLYCSNFNEKDCTVRAARYRDYLEKLFLDNKVDLVINGHKHDYERMWPTYNGTSFYSYDSPPYPVYLVNGAAGRKGAIDYFENPPAPWDAARITGYGFGYLKTHNASAMTFTYYSSITGGLLDEFTITK